MGVGEVEGGGDEGGAGAGGAEPDFGPGEGFGVAEEALAETEEGVVGHWGMLARAGFGGKLAGKGIWKCGGRWARCCGI